MKYVVRWIALFFAILWVLLPCTVTDATEQQKTVTVMGELVPGESRTQVEERTLMQAMQDVIEQTGTQISSNTTVQEMYTRDVIYAVASAIVKVQTKSYAWQGNQVTGTFSFTIDVDREHNFLKKYADDANAVMQYKQLRDEYQSLRQDIAALKQRLKDTKNPEEENQVNEKIKNKNQEYLSIIWFEKALTQKMEKDYGDALISCDTAISMDPAYPNNYGLKAEIYDDIGKEEEAIQLYQKVIDLDSEYAIPYHNIALIYHRRGEDAKALSYINQAIQFAPYVIELYVLRANIYGSLGNLQADLENCNQALSLDSRHYSALAEKAFVEYQLGMYQASIRDANMVISIQPEKCDGYFVRSVAEVVLGRRKEALADVERAVQYCQDSAFRLNLIQLMDMLSQS